MSTISETTDRTYVSSICFIDIVGYSKKSVAEQVRIKDHFVQHLARVISGVAVFDRIILDTGDGVAINFLGDPEDALFVAMQLRAAARERTGMVDQAPSDFELRIGINLGPVKLVRDINDQPNIVGDGINVAQRIMGFSQPGQIVVSRSYYDVLSKMADEFADLFRYEGSRTDKHVREHEIYIVGDSPAAFAQIKAGMERRAANANAGEHRGPSSTLSQPRTLSETQSKFAGVAHIAQTLVNDPKKMTILAWVLSGIALALVLALVTKPVSKKTPVTSEQAPAPALEVTAGAKTTPEKTDKTEKGQNSAAVKSSNDAVSSSLLADSNGNVAKADPAKMPQTGTVAFNIHPWGEIFINGKSMGVSPPKKQQKLNVGKYSIEIRNATFTPYVVVVDVKAKEVAKVEHRFQ